MVEELRARNLAIKEALAIAGEDPSEAIGKLRTALNAASAPGDRAAIAKHAGILCWGSGDLRSAVEFYTEANAAVPNDTYVHLALGQLYRELGQLGAARAALTGCLELIRKGGDRDLLDTVEKEIRELHPDSDDS